MTWKRFRAAVLVVASVSCCAVLALAAERPMLPVPPRMRASSRPAPGPLKLNYTPSTRPSTTKVKVATVQFRALFTGYTRSPQLQSQVKKLQEEAQAAKGDKAKMAEITQKWQKLQMDTQNRVREAVNDVAKREHIDVVIADTLYKAPDVELPDLTAAVTTELNEKASTEPASAPASGPATRPVP